MIHLSNGIQVTDRSTRELVKCEVKEKQNEEAISQ